MKVWKRTLCAATMLMVVSQAQPMLASEVRPISFMPEVSITQPRLMSLTGEVTYVDLEGGFFAVDGWRLIGDNEVFEQYLGEYVTVTGTLFEGMSIQMVRAIEVDTIAPGKKVPVPELPPTTPIRAIRTLPASITLNGEVVPFDQSPVVNDGVLLVPLRAVVTAAGGAIEWIESELTARVEYKGSIIHFPVGRDTGRLEKGSLVENVSMTQAPKLIAGRILVPADALSIALGMVERGNGDSSMDLISPQSEYEPQEESRMDGTIKEIQTNGRLRILVEGGPMSSGEPTLAWLTLSADIEIVREIDGEVFAVSAEDLEVGQQVDVLLSGPMLMSYPAQGGAAAVRIIDN